MVQEALRGTDQLSLRKVGRGLQRESGDGKGWMSVQH